MEEELTHLADGVDVEGSVWGAIQDDSQPRDLSTWVDSGAFIKRRLVWGCGGENESWQLGRAECQAFETLSRDVVHPASYECLPAGLSEFHSNLSL